MALEGEKLEYPGPKGTFVMKNRVTDIDSYQKLFDPVTTQRAIGEASTLYIYSEKAVQRIKHYIPDVKLIAILRNPVERAFSHYLYWTSQGYEPDTDYNFAQAIKEEENRIKNGWSHNWHYIQRGFYYQQLTRYFDIFDTSQIRVYLYEDIITKPELVTKDIFNFLNIADDVAINFQKIHNKTEVPKNRTVNTLFNRSNPIKSIVKPFIPNFLRTKIANKVKEHNTGKPILSTQIRQKLIDLYQEDILQLENLITRDLSNWLKT